MTFTSKRVKQYNSTRKSILMIDNEPVAIFDSDKRLSQAIAYVQGYVHELKDKKVEHDLLPYRIEYTKNMED